ncbi:MAG TPA: DUF2254 family protein [Polyangiaceae bacterium LLY-WYZ-15_(1-7)]|nr:hypothetical protein [Myxococcales bacterium]MAT29819.1 hypothetical protein [Sandaracinus sp.]HJK92060.1 DUF2254 family protein [Polyangiaceae bacterium LLY-WYZ-15_(1-7)]MBJ71090.1 hypothetical protein [Sandaracinus sp.]HJL01179.1 DUF2254 family protein [Polyangiaceae bacterium LLY-WYZ-15_(1-7)]
MASEPASAWRIWLLPLAILLGFAVAVYAITYAVDLGGSPGWLIALYRDRGAAADTIGNAGEIVAGVLGIAITVVAIIVELASNRYTHRVTELFVAEPINFAVMGFFVVTALQALLVGVSLPDAAAGDGAFPFAGVTVSLLLLALCLLILLPYFAFVFDFLNPIQIVDRIRAHAMKIIGQTSKHSVKARQTEAVRGVEQLADIGVNAMEHKDKGISMASVDALKAMVLEYQDVRGRLEDEWFRVEGELAHNPDFVSMSHEVLDAVSSRRIWFEMKVLRKYQTLYNEALNKMRDINYLIAINTRHLAEHALETGNDQLFELLVKFFNTYLRATVNARDVRTAYNVLHQYRLLAESALAHDDGAKAIEIARYFKYYGLVSYNAKLPFILETVAYDLCALNEMAFDEGSKAIRELLRIFLQVDKESESEVQEVSLRGVRKAQCKLATYYLAHGDLDRAQDIFRDMERERRDRLGSIRDELLGVRSSEFWEISDRGVNFDYLPSDRKSKLLEFFSWFEDLPPLNVSMMPPEEAEPSPADLVAARSESVRQREDHTLHDVPGAGADPGSDEVVIPPEA